MAIITYLDRLGHTASVVWLSLFIWVALRIALASRTGTVERDGSASMWDTVETFYQPSIADKSAPSALATLRPSTSGLMGFRHTVRLQYESSLFRIASRYGG